MSYKTHPDQQKIRHCCECGCELYADQDGTICDDCMEDEEDEFEEEEAEEK